MGSKGHVLKWWFSNLTVNPPFQKFKFHLILWIFLLVSHFCTSFYVYFELWYFMWIASFSLNFRMINLSICFEKMACVTLFIFLMYLGMFRTSYIILHLSLFHNAHHLFDKMVQWKVSRFTCINCIHLYCLIYWFPMFLECVSLSLRLH